MTITINFYDVTPEEIVALIDGLRGRQMELELKTDPKKFTQDVLGAIRGMSEATEE